MPDAQHLTPFELNIHDAGPGDETVKNKFDLYSYLS